MNIPLPHNEQERIAYITGNSMLATFAGDCDDQELLIEDFDDQLEASDTAGYDRGYKEGIGADTDTMLAAFRQEVARLKSEHQSLRTYLTDMQLCLEGDPCKTVAGRKEIATHIRRKLLATPRY